MEIKIVKDVLAKNKALADEVRKELRAKRQSMFNFMSAPGAGKTALLQKLIPFLTEKGMKVGVIEGDITTTFDSDRLKPLGVPIVQINTEFWGGDCHLESNSILGAMKLLQDPSLEILFIENVGNLVCPAEFDTGSDVNIVVHGVTEGEDKPLKYPVMFRSCQAALVNKIDLAEAAGVNLPLLRSNLSKTNAQLQIFETSARSGAGLKALADWILEKHRKLAG